MIKIKGNNVGLNRKCCIQFLYDMLARYDTHGPHWPSFTILHTHLPTGRWCLGIQADSVCEVDGKEMAQNAPARLDRSENYNGWVVVPSHSISRICKEIHITQ